MSDQPTSTDVFRFTVAEDAPFSHRLAGALAIPPLERLLGLKRCRELYAEVAEQPAAQFAEAALQRLGVDMALAADELGRIPASGPLVVVANHPYGAVEGLMLIALLRRVRSDVKVMANYLLQRLPQLADTVIAVDPFGVSLSARRNIAPLRDSLRWLKQGGVLLVFPAGEVSHFKPSHRAVADPAWSDTLGRMVRRSGAPVLPVFFPGRNGLGFQAAGMIHPRLRTALLARQLLNKRGRTLEVRIGSVIQPRQLARFESDRELIDYLRLRTYMLGCTPQRQTPSSGVNEEPCDDGNQAEAVIPPPDAKLLAAEVDRLDAGCLLAENKDLQVWQAEAAQIPYLLLEIGRLRELTFRAIGEGTGRPFDIDRFDHHYLHIFLWHKQRQELVGAYRLGRCDKILQQQGKAGLYTSTLFKYRSKLFERLGPALELGRSFVRDRISAFLYPVAAVVEGHWRLCGGPPPVSHPVRASEHQPRLQRPVPAPDRRLAAGNPAGPEAGRLGQAAGAVGQPAVAGQGLCGGHGRHLLFEYRPCRGDGRGHRR
ncbi:MAG: lysophospholipid acyltransferase family protein [Syntrophotaleaceae bacterium]